MGRVLQPTRAAARRSHSIPTSEMRKQMSSTIVIDPILAPIPQAAAMIGRGITFVYEAISDGRIRAVKSDKRTLVVVESLHEYANSLPPAVIRPMAKRRKTAA